jgi:aconitase B
MKESKMVNTIYTTDYQKTPWDNSKVTAISSKETGGITVMCVRVPTVEEQKEEIKAMNERIKKMKRKMNLNIIALAFCYGALVGIFVFIVLYVLTGGYL